MSQQFKTAKFKKLQQKWYKKLEKSGFNEIEDTNSPKEFLKRWDSQWFRTRGPQEKVRAGMTKDQSVKIQKNYLISVAKYYANARQVLSHFNFDTGLEKAIWALHSEGMSHRDIAKELNINPNVAHKAIFKIKKAIYGKR